MKHQDGIKTLLQALLMVIVELAILLALIAALGWSAWHNWPAPARATIFLAGFGLFALPVIMVTQLPYRRPAWLTEAAAHGQTASAFLLDNPYQGPEWGNIPAGRMVRLPVRLEPGGKGWLTCTLEDARSLPTEAPLAVRLDPARPERCALVKPAA